MHYPFIRSEEVKLNNILALNFCSSTFFEQHLFKMVCPMGNKAKAVEVTTHYPYESIYRPWSWILSSLFNLFLIAAILGVIYFYYRTRKSRKERRPVAYRTIQVREAGPKGDKESALVTGANGALGKEIVKSLIADGNYILYSLDVLLPEEEYRNEGVCTYIQADITSLDDLCIAFKNVDVVFHCASLTPVSIRHSKEDYYRVNVEGTENVIKACVECGVKRLLYTSSASITVSRNPKVTSVDSNESSPIPSDPLNIYVATKGKADQLVQAANGKAGLLTCILRPNAFIHSIFTALQGSLYCPSNGGDFEISVVSVESVAQAHVLAEKKLLDGEGKSMVAGKAYNISNENVTISEFTKFIASEKKTSVTHVPFSLVKLLALLNEVVYKWTGLVTISESLTTMSMNYKTHTYVSHLAQRELGWSPSTPWREVVRELLKKNEENKKDN